MKTKHETACCGLKPKYSKVSASSYSDFMKIIMYVLATTECFFFGATCYGWTSFSYVYLKKNVYADLCSDSETLLGTTNRFVCYKTVYQSEHLNLIAADKLYTILL